MQGTIKDFKVGDIIKLVGGGTTSSKFEVTLVGVEMKNTNTGAKWQVQPDSMFELVSRADNTSSIVLYVGDTVRLKNGECHYKVFSSSAVMCDIKSIRSGSIVRGVLFSRLIVIEKAPAELKNGDRIIVTKQWVGASPGMVGTIINSGARPGCGIRFDKEFNEGHDCAGLCDYGKGYYVHPDNFKLYEGISKPLGADEDRNILLDEHFLKEGDVVVPLENYRMQGILATPPLKKVEHVVTCVNHYPGAQFFKVVGSSITYTFNTKYFKLKEKGGTNMNNADSERGVIVNPDIAREFGESKEANKMLLVNKHFGEGTKLFSFLMDEVLHDKRAKLIKAAEKLEEAEDTGK